MQPEHTQNREATDLHPTIETPLVRRYTQSFLNSMTKPDFASLFPELLDSDLITNKFSKSEPPKLDDERGARIASMIRHHKDAYTDKTTGVISIPKRNTSNFTIPDSKESAMETLKSLTSISLLNIPKFKDGTNVLVSNTLEIVSHSARESSPIDVKLDPPSVLDLPIENKELIIESTDLFNPDSPTISTDIGSSDIILPSSDPVEFGKQLFHENLANYPQNKIAPTIGKLGDFSKQALNAYMDCFDFSNVSLDEAFRLLCQKLELTGETQMIDRILYQVSRRFWDCNIDAHHLYRSIDIVYGTLFSIVLLNTDLNTVNVGSKSHKKMSQKVFIKNTLDLMINMIEKDETIQKDVALHPDQFRKWKKELEQLLKDIYISVSNNPIIRITSDPKPPELTQEISRSSSSWSITTPSFTSLSHAPSEKKVLRRGHSASLLSNDTSGQSIDSVNAQFYQILLEGVLIRKHLTESNGDKARNRRWSKLWCAIRISKGGGPELALEKLSFSHTIDREYVDKELDTPISYSESSAYPTVTHKNTIKLEPNRLNVGEKFNCVDNGLSIPPHPVFSSSHEYKISSSSDYEPLPLVHSFTTIFHHGSGRNHCFSLHLADNRIFVFHCPNEDSLNAWTTTINYWAARKSREPMRGGIGNVDYGWNNVNLESSDKERGYSMDATINRQRERITTGTRSHSSDTNSQTSYVQSVGNFKKSKLKLAKWEEPSISYRLVSSKNEIQQLESMKKQLEIIKKEIEDHESCHSPMIKMFSDAPPLCQQAISNWERKNYALHREFEKYDLYVESLTSTMAVGTQPDGDSPIFGETIVTSPSFLQQSPAKSSPASNSSPTSKLDIFEVLALKDNL
ncbi:hypothetical protein BC833DRAFT_591154 [Globomyces pollinis-pini]|nr:hypothetical protein BC833DRAFT_591154 [Globomyces pollinis-pini]